MAYPGGARGWPGGGRGGGRGGPPPHGSPPDAPFLKAEILVDRPEGRAKHALDLASLNQPAGLCDRTPQVRDKLLEITGISGCAQVTLSHLAQVSRLDLSGSGITELKADDFSGLVALQSLLLNGNSLKSLPNGLFSGTGSLRELWLQDNALSRLPAGVLDDVIHGLVDLRVDPHIKARLAFESAAQETVAGPNVQVRLKLSRALPVAVRVPYSVSGTAAKTDYGNLSPSPEVGILFRAGETGGEITFTTAETSEALGKTVVLTLGDLSEIRLRRSDGGGTDAPGLNAGVLLVRPSTGVVHTVTIVDPDQTVDVCDRTPQVRDKLVQLTGATGCWQLSRTQMASVRALDLSDSGIGSLQQHDFSGLSSLESLNLHDNTLAELPENVFAGLSRLRNLTFYRNSLRTLPEGLFRGLISLQELWLSTNSLASLPEGVFSGLSNLQTLTLANNTLRSLPEGVFSGLSALRTLHLDFNSLATLPEGIFRDLGSLEALRLWSNQLNSLPAGIFRGLHSLRTLWLSDNSLTSLPAGIFDDILDTLGPSANNFGDLWLDPPLKAAIAFASDSQRAFYEHTVRARVDLTRALPVAVRVPFSVSGTATADAFAVLSPDPDSGLLFLAGETSKEIVFSLLNNESNKRTTIELTLGELSRIGLRRSDGTGPDAPFLNPRTLLNRPDDKAAHSVTLVSPRASADVCNRTPQVRDKLTEAAGVSSCEQVTVGHLAGLTRLDLAGSGITWLGQDDFSGLIGLQALYLNNNFLRDLPRGVFDGLSKLETLWLQDNFLTELPEGILDDLVDTLEDLRIDPRLKSRLLFHLTKQHAVAGAFVRVRVWLSHGLPVAVRVPFTVSGTASTHGYGRLSPTPESGLLFLAGERSHEIEFALSEEANALGKTVVLTLGSTSRIGLRRSDGEGNDAPGLASDILLDRPAGSASHTVTVTDPDEPAMVCQRTPLVRDRLMRATGNSTCGDVTLADLSRVTRLDFRNSEISTLEAHDFKGLSSLEFLWLRNNNLTELPEEVFQGLHNVTHLTLQRNSLSRLPRGVFRGLHSLKSLGLNYNRLRTLPEGIFSEANALEDLTLYGNSLSALPSGAFRGLGNLRELHLHFNRLNFLPEGIFHGLSALEELSLSEISLRRLPRGIFRGLRNLKGLGLGDNQLSNLPDGVFNGLGNLQSLGLSYNNLRSLPPGIFRGLRNLRELYLWENPLGELPRGVLDDALDTLGADFLMSFGLGLETYRRGRGILSGRLVAPRHLKADLAFASTEQRALEGATVRVPVALSRALPVAVRVPYNIGFGGAVVRLTGLSPEPDGGLLFRAGETRQEISFTLPRQVGTQGKRTVILDLGKPSEIGLRRSDGRGPDAPYLLTENLVLRSDQGAVHTVMVFDHDPPDREPFCLSLWEGAPCGTVSTIPHLFLGPVGESIATTELTITHKDPAPPACEVAALFHRGTSPASAASFNGRFLFRNVFRTTIARGGAEVLTLSAPDARGAVTGAVYIFTRSPCTADSLHVKGRTWLENRIDGEIDELFPLDPQSPEEWLGDGDCRVLAGVFGNGGNVGIAAVTTQPGQAAPPATRIRFQAFDLQGNFITRVPGLEVSGGSQAVSPWQFDQATSIRMCLDVPGKSGFQLAVTAIGATVKDAGVQFVTESLHGGGGSGGNGSDP
ncbi:MAG: leucine-rich repeat domain-containing protein [Acidobacteriota bacterium]|nr:leucine-rich repeat domain-containing protein [Acidobacteriota bacterium]